MATVKTDERNYMNIANAIREKTGSQETFTPGEMDAAILSIPAGSGGSGLTEEVKQALLDCFENVAWINDQGQTYYEALEAALYPPANLVSISAVFTQGSAVIYNTDSLDTLKRYLVVTAHYSDSSTGTITNYTLSGTLTVGTSVITVSYGGKTTTFNVTVSEIGGDLPSEYQKVAWIGVENSSQVPTAYIEAGLVINAGDVLYAEIKPFSIVDQYDSPLGGAYNTGYPLWELYYTQSGNALEVYSVSVGGGIKAVLDGDYSYVIGSWDNVSINFSANTMLNILTYKNNQYAFNGKIKTLVVKNSNDVVTHNYVPCYRKSDDVIGMYDTVVGVFHMNAGTGSFVKGENV